MSRWRTLSLRQAGVKLIDCDHRTPPAIDAGYPYVALPQVKNGRIDIDAARRISPEHFSEWTKKTNPSPYDVVLSRRCNPGETAFVAPGMQFALGQNLVLLRADGEVIFPPFLRWLVRTSEWWNQVGRFINVGAVFNSLKCADIPNFELPIPPLNEQRAIAHILGTLDDKIELNRRMNETLEAIARAIFQSWFVDFDPVRAKANGESPDSICRRLGLTPDLLALFPNRLVGSELGEIPEGWESSTVGKHFKLIMGQSPPGSTYNESGEGLPLFQGRTDFGFRFPSRRVFCTAPTRLAEVSDTLVSVRAPVGDVNIAIEPCAIGRGVAAVRHQSGGRSFTHYAMRNLGEHFGKFEGEGTVFGSINKADFQRLPFAAPPPTVVARFEQLVSPLDDRIESNELELRTLAAVRDTLLPKLLSGELHVPERDTEVLS